MSKVLAEGLCYSLWYYWKKLCPRNVLKSNMEQILLCKRNNRYISAGLLASLNFHLLSSDQFFAVLPGSWYSTSGKLQLISKTYFKKSIEWNWRLSTEVTERDIFPAPLTLRAVKQITVMFPSLITENVRDTS